MGGRGPLSFDGRIGRWAFLLGSLILLALQQVFGHLLMGDYWFSPTAFLNPWLTPLHDAWFPDTYGSAAESYRIAIPAGLILLTDWALAILGFRRANTVGAHPGLAAAVVIPFVQLVTTLVLAVMRDRPRSEPPSSTSGWRASLIGMLAGAGIAVAGAVFSTLVLRVYGTTLFFGVPLFMGLAAGIITRNDPDPMAHAVRAVGGAMLLGSLALAGFAIEGLLCLLMASPLIGVMGVIGAILGSAFATRGRADGRTTYAFGLLPLLLLAEAAAPPHTSFESAESIEIAAPPAAVWDSIVHMGPIPDRPAAPFGWGLAYPMRGSISGEGVGAVREGVFSTGIAYERVTEWHPNSKLSFAVLSDPPTMRELSPYPVVAAPHTVGYFRTRDAIFTIDPLANGRTRLTLTTHHDLDIGPTAYWSLFAKWAVHANKQRVLAHFRNQAERR